MDSPDNDKLQNVLKPANIEEYRLLQYIIENDRSAIALLNRELRYIYVSKRFLVDYKIKEKDILGKLHYDVFPDIPEFWKEVHQRALKGEIMSSDEDMYARADGTIEWVRWTCHPWYEFNGSVGGIILYTEVITRQKESEMELINAKEKAEKNEKLMSDIMNELHAAKEKAEESDRLKTAFLQNMSHEVRTPLNSIVGFSQLLSEPGLPLQKIKSFSKIITANSNRLIGIISDVIEISRIHSKQVEMVITRFDIAQSFNKIVDSFREIVQLKDVEFITDLNIPLERSHIVSDQGKLEKIFFHLIDNAVKFTYRGTIRILAEVRDESLSFKVSDTGIGIAGNKQNIIFDPFRQIETGLNRNSGGTGLGLTIVKAYVDALKGTISLNSEINMGTVIEIKIPLPAGSVKKTSSVRETGEINPSGKLLIAEDEYSNFQFLYEVLHPEGIEILHANNGREAVEICRDSEDIKMVLMDLKMPVMDGTSAAKQIRKFRPELPIVAQTAYIPETENMDVFDDLITKPVNMQDLKDKVNHYLGVTHEI